LSPLLMRAFAYKYGNSEYDYGPMERSLVVKHLPGQHEQLAHGKPGLSEKVGDWIFKPGVFAGERLKGRVGDKVRQLGEYLQKEGWLEKDYTGTGYTWAPHAREIIVQADILIAISIGFMASGILTPQEVAEILVPELKMFSRKPRSRDGKWTVEKPSRVAGPSTALVPVGKHLAGQHDQLTHDPTKTPGPAKRAIAGAGKSIESHISAGLTRAFDLGFKPAWNMFGIDKLPVVRTHLQGLNKYLIRKGVLRNGDSWGGVTWSTKARRAAFDTAFIVFLATIPSHRFIERLVGRGLSYVGGKWIIGKLLPPESKAEQNPEAKVKNVLSRLLGGQVESPLEKRSPEELVSILEGLQILNRSLIKDGLLGEKDVIGGDELSEEGRQKLRSIAVGLFAAAKKARGAEAKSSLWKSLIEKRITRRGDKWCVVSEKGKSLGCGGSEGWARKRLAQVEYFKHKKSFGDDEELIFGSLEEETLTPPSDIELKSFVEKHLSGKHDQQKHAGNGRDGAIEVTDADILHAVVNSALKEHPDWSRKRAVQWAANKKNWPRHRLRQLSVRDENGKSLSEKSEASERMKIQRLRKRYDVYVRERRRGQDLTSSALQSRDAKKLLRAQRQRQFAERLSALRKSGVIDKILEVKSITGERL